MTIRVLVADEREAAFFDVDGVKMPLRQTATLEDTTARMRDRELESDRPGRAHDSLGGHRHAMDGERSARRQGESRFARRIAEEIERGRNSQEFDKLVIMAAPRMLGLIREVLPQASRPLVAAEISKDLVHHDADAIREHVPREVFNRIE